jgi:cytochrome P450
MASAQTFATASRLFIRWYGRLFSTNPYPLYRYLRRHHPLLRTPIGFWIATRYADCHSIMRDRRFDIFDMNALDAFPGDDGLKSMREALRHGVVFRNPPDHTRLRKLLAGFFSNPVVDAMQARIQNIVDRLLDAVQERGSMDLIADLAFPLPIDVLAEIMGVPEEDKPLLRGWVRNLGVPLDPVVSVRNPGVQVRREVAAAISYFTEMAADRRQHPREDVISLMVAGQARDEVRNEEELVANAIFMLLAGHETTMNMIGNGTLALLRHPGALARLRNEPSLIDSAIDEFLRFDSPAQVTFRTAAEDVEVAGRTIPAGAHVVVVLGAANRDPARFPDPDRFDITRPDNNHLSFAAGIHRCVGEPLARMEGNLAFETLLRRMPKLALATPTVKWRPALALRGLQSLPLTF